MPNIAVVGGQWGDEGKGKIVDFVADRFDVVARYQGGPNAGHTVHVGAVRHALHHVPSAAFRPGVRMVVGNGTVLDLASLIEEVDGLAAAGVELEGRLVISDRAHVILPIMARLDALSERDAEEGAKIGTTQRGIGPAYEAKVGRRGLRVADLARPETLRRRVRDLLEGPLGRRLHAGGETLPDPERVAEEAEAAGRKLGPYVADTASLLNAWIDEGASVLFEGAQGTLLDVDHGTYPFVTSSSTTAGGLCAGLGVSPTLVDGVVGVFKAYATRVGAGPLPTELDDGPGGPGDALRTRGREYGTTTGRPRRCGWFDGVAAAYSGRLNRFDAVCVTLLDVLDAFAELKIGIGYRVGDEDVSTLPADAARAAALEPVLETLPGWRRPTSEVRSWEALPAEARRYLDRLEELIGAEVAAVSVGPERSQSIIRPRSWLARELGL